MTFMLGQVDLSSYHTLTAPTTATTAATPTAAYTDTELSLILVPLPTVPLPPVPLPYTESNICDVYLAKQI